MGTFIETTDLAPFATIAEDKAEAMIADAEATASLAAPCITGAEFAADKVKVAALRAILRGAILRWAEAGTGAVSQQTTGPYSHTLDTRQERRAMFWPSEIEQLRDLCSGGSCSAYSVDTAPYLGPLHAAACNVYFGREDCSCGAVLTGGEPLYEV